MSGYNGHINEGTEMERSGKKDWMVTLAVLLVIVLIVTGVIITSKSDDNTSFSVPDTTTTAPQSEDTTAATVPEETSAETSGYQDGTYSATGKYSTPEDTESSTVSITLKDGTVTDTSATASMSSRDSKEYASQFIQNYKSLVVGKNIKDIKLSRVSGSSLTSQGFNRAIEQIKTDAAS